MYDELVKILRVCGDSNNSCGNCSIRENDGSCPHGEWEFAAEKYMLQAADAIEELNLYVQQMEKLRKEGWFLQKTKMMTYGQATMTMPLPKPPKEE